jgi:hypothetical protein
MVAVIRDVLACLRYFLFFAFFLTAASFVQAQSQYSGSWYNDDRVGEGFHIEILDDDNALIIWFTYPGSSDSAQARQAWILGTGTVENDMITVIDAYKARGPIFGQSYSKDDFSIETWGDLTVRFTDNNSGVVEYSGLDGAGSTQVVRLTALAEQGGTAGYPVGLSGAWYNDDTVGQGWFVEVLSGEQALVYFFTYDENGSQAWNLEVGFIDGNKIVVPGSYAGTGTRFGSEFDQDDVTLEPFVDIELEFKGCHDGSASYRTLDGTQQGTLPIVRLTSVQGKPCKYFPVNFQFEMLRPNEFVSNQTGAKFPLPSEGSVALDANNDGLEDFLIAPTNSTELPELPLQIYLNEGGGRFREAADEVLDSVPYIGYINHPTLVADFNGDGADDVFLIDHGLEAGPQPTWQGAQPKLLLSKGDGTLSDKSATHLPSIMDFHHSGDFADLDNDGDIDIIVVALPLTDGAPSTFLLINDGNGKFELNTTKLPESFRGYELDLGSISFAYINDDDRVDIAAGSYVNASEKLIVIALQESDGHFVATDQYSLREELSVDGVGIDLILSADIDRDGDDDLIAKIDQVFDAPIVGGLMVLRNDAGTFVDATDNWLGATLLDDLLPNISISGMFLEDISGDEFPDLTFAHAGFPANELGHYLFINDGTGRMVPESDVGLFDSIGITPFYLDHDGDGDVDVVGAYPRGDQTDDGGYFIEGFELVILENLHRQ